MSASFSPDFTLTGLNKVYQEKLAKLEAEREARRQMDLAQVQGALEKVQLRAQRAAEAGLSATPVHALRGKHDSGHKFEHPVDQAVWDALKDLVKRDTLGGSLYTQTVARETIQPPDDVEPDATSFPHAIILSWK